MIDIDIPSEGIDYQVVNDDAEGQSWLVEFIRGPYEGVKLKFSNIMINGITKQIQYTTSFEGPVDYDETLEYYISNVIQQIIAKAIVDKAVVFREIGDGNE